MATQITETQQIRRIEHNPLKRIVPITDDYSIGVNDDIIIATIGSDKNLYLDVASVNNDDTNYYSSIIDITNDETSVGDLTIIAKGTSTINDESEFVLYAGENLTLYFDGTNWKIK
jgi:hypothetical protein